MPGRSVLRRRMLGWVICGALLPAALAAVGLTRAGSGRRDAPPQPAPPAPAPLEEAATRMVRARLRNRGAAEFLDLRVFRFGPEDERAVCGRVRPGEGLDAETGFVVRILLPRPAGGRLLAILEDGPGIPRFGDDARRRYCRDAAAPAPDAPPSGGTPAMVAGPDAAAPAETLGGSTAGGGRPAAQMVVVRSPANLRAGPGGWAAVLRTAPRGEAFRVHGHAPGGWVQVGDMERPLGWVHSSLLEQARP